MRIKRLDEFGFNGYAVSDCGKVFSYWTKQGVLCDDVQRQLKPDVLKRGYLRATLRHGRMCYRRIAVHQLVMLAFVGPMPKGKIVLHWDNDPQNNCIDNLRYGTHKENEEDKKRHGTHQTGEGNPAAKLTDDDVREIRRIKSERGSEWGLNVSLAMKFKVSTCTIKDAASGRKWRHVS